MDTLWRFLWVSIPVVLLLCAAVYVPVKLHDDNGYRRIQRISAELEALEARNRRIQRENESLRTQIQAIQSDPDYIENLARNEMGMIGPDEVVYQF